MNQIVYLYVLNTMADWETGYLAAELNSGRYFRKGIPPLRIITVGADRNPVTTMGGLKIIPEITVEDCSPQDASALILPGGDTWMESLHDPILDRVGDFLNQEVIVGAICGATFGLARKGYLDEIPHTSNSLDYLKQICRDYKGEAFYREETAAVSGGLITASGVAPLEFANQVISALGVFSPETLQAWFHLNLNKKEEHFYQLISSVL